MDIIIISFLSGISIGYACYVLFDCNNSISVQMLQTTVIQLVNQKKILNQELNQMKNMKMMEELKKENIPPRRECVICIDNPAIVALVPCGHNLYCPSCASKLSTCAVCKSKITNIIPIYQ